MSENIDFDPPYDFRIDMCRNKDKIYRTLNTRNYELQGFPPEIATKMANEPPNDTLIITYDDDFVPNLGDAIAKLTPGQARELQEYLKLKTV